jgi:phage pi2 protein 07
MKKFNLYTQIQSELDDYFNNKISIAGVQGKETARYLDAKKGGDYLFSQNEMINFIDLYWNSKFEAGEKDSEGQRKFFLNTSRFRSDVASKQIDIDLKDFNYFPEEGNNEWISYFFKKRFTMWAKDSYFSELINKCVEHFPKYGWVILKSVKDSIDLVPLQQIRCQQDAKSVHDAKYFIIQHDKMCLNDIKNMKGWDSDGLDMDYDDEITVYERYGHIPVAFLKENKGEKVKDEDYDNTVDCIAICTLDKSDKKSATGKILFIEEISQRPFEEARWSDQYGRLMPVGEMESQIENQIGINFAVNLHRRQLLWSSKKVFQSPYEGVAKNLIRDVKDGDIMQIAPNGNITQVDMSDRVGADFNNFMETMNKNADQKSFTYEVATGESLPSGTPFRLGVILSNAVNSHFKLKRQKLGLFFKRVIDELVIPQFKKDNTAEHLVTIFAGEEGYEALKKVLTEVNLIERLKTALLGNHTINIDEIKQQISTELDSKRLLSGKITEKLYDNYKFTTLLSVVGEEIDIPKKLETLTNLYTTLSQKGDPRAEKVLSKILAYTGESYDLLVGANPQQTPQAIQGQPTGGNPQDAQSQLKLLLSNQQPTGASTLQ